MKLKIMWLPSSPKGEIVGIMIQVLSLMATHSGDRSLFLMISSLFLRRTQVICSESASPQVYHAEPTSRDAGQPFRGCVHPVHTFQDREKHVGVSCVVSSRRFCVSMVSARGIVPCFGEELAYIKKRSSFGLIMFLVEHLMRARSGLDLNKANLMDRDLFGSCSDL